MGCEFGFVYDPIAIGVLAVWAAGLAYWTDEDGRHAADRFAGTRVVRTD